MTSGTIPTLKSRSFGPEMRLLGSETVRLPEMSKTAAMQEFPANRAPTRGADAVAWGIAPFAIVASLVAALPGPAFGRSGSIAAVFPPWWHQARVFEAAAGAGPLLNTGQASFVVVVGFSDPGVVDRLRSAGALIL